MLKMVLMQQNCNARFVKGQIKLTKHNLKINTKSSNSLQMGCLIYTFITTNSQDEVRNPRQVWARPTWVADRGVQTEQTRIQVWARQNSLVTLSQTEQTQGQHWTRQNQSKINPGPDRKDSGPGPDRTDPRPTLGQTEQTWPRTRVEFFRPK